MVTVMQIHYWYYDRWPSFHVMRDSGIQVFKYHIGQTPKATSTILCDYFNWFLLRKQNTLQNSILMCLFTTTRNVFSHLAFQPEECRMKLKNVKFSVKCGKRHGLAVHDVNRVVLDMFSFMHNIIWLMDILHVTCPSFCLWSSCFQ